MGRAWRKPGETLKIPPQLKVIDNEIKELAEREKILFNSQPEAYRRDVDERAEMSKKQSFAHLDQTGMRPGIKVLDLESGETGLVERDEIGVKGKVLWTINNRTLGNAPDLSHYVILGIPESMRDVTQVINGATYRLEGDPPMWRNLGAVRKSFSLSSHILGHLHG